MLTCRNAALNTHFGEHSSKHSPNKNVETYRKTAQLPKNSLVLWHSPASLFLTTDAAKRLWLALFPPHGTQGSKTPSPHTIMLHHPLVTHRQGRSLRYFFFLCFLISILSFLALRLCAVCISSHNHPRIRTPKPIVLTGKMQTGMGDMQNYFYL